LSPRSDAAVRMTAQPLASLPGRRVSALLDFDSPDDLTFVTSEPANVIRADARLARSGRTKPAHPARHARNRVKLPSLLSGRSFPADWTLAGAYIQCDRTTVVTMSYEVGGRALLSRSVSIAPSAWTPADDRSGGAGDGGRRRSRHPAGGRLTPARCRPCASMT
jgi:hypothetical protein